MVETSTPQHFKNCLPLFLCFKMYCCFYQVLVETAMLFACLFVCLFVGLHPPIGFPCFALKVTGIIFLVLFSARKY